MHAAGTPSSSERIPEQARESSRIGLTQERRRQRRRLSRNRMLLIGLAVAVLVEHLANRSNGSEDSAHLHREEDLRGVAVGYTL
jgi:hypothetical protein